MMKTNPSSRFNSYLKRLLKDIDKVDKYSRWEVGTLLEHIRNLVKARTISLEHLATVAYILELSEYVRDLREAGKTAVDLTFREQRIDRVCARLAGELGVRY